VWASHWLVARVADGSAAAQRDRADGTNGTAGQDPPLAWGEQTGRCERKGDLCRVWGQRTEHAGMEVKGRRELGSGGTSSGRRQQGQ